MQPKGEGDELRMPADEFNRMMRRALQTPPEPKTEPEKPAKRGPAKRKASASKRN